MLINCRLKNPWNEEEYSAYMAQAVIVLYASGESHELMGDSEIDEYVKNCIRQLEKVGEKAKKMLSDEKQKIKKGMEEESQRDAK